MTITVHRHFYLKYAIILLPALGVIGGYLGDISLGFAHLSAYRIAIILLLPLSLLVIRLPHILAVDLYELLFGLWLVYGCLSLLWSPNLASGVVELLAIGFGVSVAIVFMGFKVYEEDRIDWLRKGWVFAFVLTAAVAVWEIYTGNHLESEFSISSLYYPDMSFIQSTLGNPNDYGAFIVICIPFLLWSLLISKKSAPRAYYLFLLLAAVLLVFKTASRLSVLALVLEIFVFGVLKARKRLYRLLNYAVAAMFFLIMLVAAWPMIQSLGNQVPVVQKFSSLLRATEVDESSLNRQYQTLNGLWMLNETAGFGVGAGGFQTTILTKEIPIPIWTSSAGLSFLLVDPHNLALEIASQYGWFVFALFALWIIRCGIEFMRALRWSDHDKESISVSFMAGLAGFAVISFATSTMLRQSWPWLYFASLLVATLYVWKKRDVTYL